MEDVAIYSDLKDLLPLCDYVTIHVPASDSTKGMFNDQLFSLMKDSSVLLNFPEISL